ncbi:unknown [Prevotella sp. CAG:1185]|nr:unknown [Prevotella sp. CAG:1185]
MIMILSIFEGKDTNFLLIKPFNLNFFVFVTIFFYLSQKLHYLCK